jgi:hypothetical protein
MTTYLLSCGCGARAEVGPGQAGGRAACPRCGATLTVPRLGELTRLPVAVAAPPTRRPWTAAHACLLGGGCVAAIALASALYLRTGPRAVFEPDTIRHAVAMAPAADVYKAWQALSRSGVGRPASPAEERATQVARVGQAVGTVLLAVAATAAAVALGGGAVLARGRRPRP